MKLFLEDISSINIDNISDYRFNDETNKYIYTDDGFFKCSSNDIFRYTEINDDDNIKKIKFNNTWLICDNSKIHNLERWHQISTLHILEVINSVFYELRPKALVKLVIEYLNNKVIHVYFKTNENIQSTNIKEDIDTFLSLLKIY